jgi:hypothetical protein
LNYVDRSLAAYLGEIINAVESFKDLSKALTEFVEKANKKVVLMIDEVDKSSNNQLFLSFLGMLRSKYLLRNDGIFQNENSILKINNKIYEHLIDEFSIGLNEVDSQMERSKERIKRIL